MREMTYKINQGGVVWLQGSNGQVAIFKIGQASEICLSGLEAILWRTLWLGFSPDMWQPLAQEQAMDLDCLIRDWENKGLIFRIGR